MFFLHHCRTPEAPPLRTEPGAILSRLMPLRPADHCGFRREGERSLLVQTLHWNTPQSRLEPAPFRHAGSGVQGASWARLDNRPELAAKLGLSRTELADCCDTELIVRSYLQWGEDCPEHLVGDFAFVILDPTRDRIFCGRDPMGPRPLYYLASDSVFTCATTLAALNPLDGAFLEIDPCWIADYTMGLSMGFERTPYRQVQKLAPGHCLSIAPNRMQLRQYCRLSAEPELRLRDSREYVEAYRAQLEEAIRCRLVSDSPLGSELSGGIDSSTITTLAAKLMERPQERLHTFGYAFLEQEAEHIQAVNEAFGLPNTHVFTDRKTFHRRDPERALSLLGYPEEHGNATAHEPIYQKAEQLGIRTLLSGFGGDEFSTTIHGNLVPLGLAVQGRYRELLHILPGNPLARFLRMVKLELRRRKTSNFTQAPPCRMLEAYRQRWPHRVLREEWVERAQIRERYFDEGRFDMGYTDLKDFTLERRWAPCVPTRMENCSLMAAGRGIEYRWPLLDVRLVRLFLAIPSEENYFRGMGRYLHRRAIDGVVPDKVAWKPSKNMGGLVAPPGAEHMPLQPSDLAHLHPALSEFIDLDLLRQQLEAFPDLTPETGDPRPFQFRKNARAALNLSDWLKRMDAMERP